MLSVSPAGGRLNPWCSTAVHATAATAVVARAGQGSYTWATGGRSWSCTDAVAAAEIAALALEASATARQQVSHPRAMLALAAEVEVHLAAYAPARPGGTAML
jgi:N-acetylglucosamine kinase-like BadF-type ATPase